MPLDAVQGVIGGTDTGVAGVAGVHGQLGLLHPDAPDPTEHVGLVAALLTLAPDVGIENDVRIGLSLLRRLAAKPGRGPRVGGGEAGGVSGAEGAW